MDTDIVLFRTKKGQKYSKEQSELGGLNSRLTRFTIVHEQNKFHADDLKFVLFYQKGFMGKAKCTSVCCRLAPYPGGEDCYLCRKVNASKVSPQTEE